MVIFTSITFSGLQFEQASLDKAFFFLVYRLPIANDWRGFGIFFDGSMS